jgi:large subunit ribosomal protein L9
MKVILKKDHDKLGNTGDILSVKYGYAMNFLIPNGYAMKATASNMKSFEEIKKQREKKTRQEIENSEKMAGEVKDKEITINVKTHEENKIYGSVTPQMITEKLAEIGFNIDKKHIILSDHIKETGDYDVELKFEHNVRSNIKVHVVPEATNEE